MPLRFEGNQETIFLCRYLSLKALRREVHEGLNVVEQWNGATDFVFFARRGEMASNRREDHEISMLSLHLIQNCRVYINTLMIQKVLARPRWQQAMTPRDYAALTPLIWSHVNPYGPCPAIRAATSRSPPFRRYSVIPVPRKLWVKACVRRRGPSPRIRATASVVLS